jgi:hypothetical protein
MDIRIVDNDTKPPWDDINFSKMVHLPDAVWKVALLAEGMGSGLPSVALRLTLPDGTEVIAETSLAIWSSVTIAGRAKWPVAFAGGPLDPGL